MSSAQKHDYHLVDPSPWPIATSFATLITALGTVYYLHAQAMWAMSHCLSMQIINCS